MIRLLSTLALAAIASVALAADWPCFRGPNRDDISPDKGLLKEWKEAPKLVWKCKGIGEGFSTVSVVGDLIYTMGDKDGSSYVFAITKDKGEIKWSTKVGKAGGNYSGTRCTPTVSDGLVYAVGQFGDFVCLDAKTGEEKWRKSFTADYKGRAGRWNFTESPLIDGDRVVVTPGGPKASMVCLKKKDGEEVWRCDGGFSAGYSSIVISNAAGVKQYVQLTANGTVGVSAKDGKLLWQYKKLGGNIANVPTPIVIGDQILSVAGYGKGGALLTLSKDGDGIEVKEEYYKNALRNKHGGVVKVGDYLFGDTDNSGNPYCAEWKTGKVKWTRNADKKRAGKGRGSVSLTCADGHLYLRYSNGYVALVPATADGYTEKGSFRIPNAGSDQSWAHPVVIDGRLYLREKDTLWVYDVKAKKADKKNADK